MTQRLAWNRSVPMASSVCHKIPTGRWDGLYGSPLFHAKRCLISPSLPLYVVPNNTDHVAWLWQIHCMHFCSFCFFIALTTVFLQMKLARVLQRKTKATADLFPAPDLANPSSAMSSVVGDGMMEKEKHEAPCPEEFVPCIIWDPVKRKRFKRRAGTHNASSFPLKDWKKTELKTQSSKIKHRSIEIIAWFFWTIFADGSLAELGEFGAQQSDKARLRWKLDYVTAFLTDFHGESAHLRYQQSSTPETKQTPPQMEDVEMKQIRTANGMSTRDGPKLWHPLFAPNYTHSLFCTKLWHPLFAPNYTHFWNIHFSETNQPNSAWSSLPMCMILILRMKEN